MARKPAHPGVLLPEFGSCVLEVLRHQPRPGIADLLSRFPTGSGQKSMTVWVLITTGY